MTEPEIEAAAQKIGTIVDTMLVDVATAYPGLVDEVEIISLIGATVQRLLATVSPDNRIEIWRSVVRGIEERFKDKRL